MRDEMDVGGRQEGHGCVRDFDGFDGGFGVGREVGLELGFEVAGAAAY